MTKMNWNTSSRRPSMDIDRLNWKLDNKNCDKQKKLSGEIRKKLPTITNSDHLKILTEAMNGLNLGLNMTSKQSGIWSLYKGVTK